MGAPACTDYLKLVGVGVGWMGEKLTAWCGGGTGICSCSVIIGVGGGGGRMRGHAYEANHVLDIATDGVERKGK